MNLEYNGHRIKTLYKGWHQCFARVYRDHEIVWCDGRIHATHELAAESARKWIDALPFTVYRGHKIEVAATGTNFGYTARISRDGMKAAVLDPPCATAKAAREQAEAMIDRMRYTVRVRGCSAWTTVDSFEEALRERERANRQCQPGHIIVPEVSR